MNETTRYRLDDLRRLATTLAAGVGVPPARAALLATELLWFDAAGAPNNGIATLPGWLDRIESGQVDPNAEGTVTTETTATAVLDARNGLPPLLLARAGEIAVEKAREAGVGLVRVGNLGPGGPAAAVTAGLAIGPFVGLALGPGPEWSIALPTADGLPAVFDAALGTPTNQAPRGWLPDGFAPWAEALAPDGGWLIAALGVAAFEPLATFHERLSDLLKDQPETPARLLPRAWEAHRRDAREHGVALPPASWSALATWAARLNVPLPPGQLPPGEESVEHRASSL